MRALLCALLISSMPAFAGKYGLTLLGLKHPSAVKKIDARWLGFFRDRIAPVKVKSVEATNPIPDDSGEPYLDVSVAGDERPMLLLKGLTAKQLKPLSLEGLPALNSGNVKIDFPGTALVSRLHGAHGQELVLVRGTVEQVIYANESGDIDAWELKWVGDLDADGQLDFLIDADFHYAQVTTRLFLSSQAKKGELVHQVATVTADSC